MGCLLVVLCFLPLWLGYYDGVSLIRLLSNRPTEWDLRQKGDGIVCRQIFPARLTKQGL